MPWPNASLTDGSPVIRLTLATTLFASAACGEMPESTTATPMPWPLTPGIAPIPNSPPATPARTWSAAVAWLETDIPIFTSGSPDRWS